MGKAKKAQRPMKGFSKITFGLDDEGAGTALACSNCGKLACFCKRSLTQKRAHESEAAATSENLRSDATKEPIPLGGCGMEASEKVGGSANEAVEASSKAELKAARRAARKVMRKAEKAVRKVEEEAALKMNEKAARKLERKVAREASAEARASDAARGGMAEASLPVPASQPREPPQKRAKRKQEATGTALHSSRRVHIWSCNVSTCGRLLVPPFPIPPCLIPPCPFPPSRPRVQWN